MEKLFPKIPADLASLTTDALHSLIAEFRAVVSRLAARDEDLTGNMTDAKLLEAAQYGAETIVRMNADVEARDAASAQTDAQLAEFAATAGVTTEAADGETEPAGDGDETASVEGDDDAAADEDEDEDADTDSDAAEAATDGDTAAESEEGAESEEAEGAGEALAASATAATVKPSVGVAKRNRPKPVTARAVSDVRSLATVPGLMAGDVLDSEEKLVTAFQENFNNIVGTRPTGEKIRVLRARLPYPESNQFDDRDARGNTSRMHAARQGRQALVASGGLCAPVAPYYDLAILAENDRPVRDSLVGFQATRGGITFAEPIGIADITTAVGVVTEAEDAVGGTTGAKTKQHVECGSFTTVTIDAVYNWLEFGNLGARAWPEQVANMIATADAAHARVAETKLLDEMDGVATPVDAGTMAGAVADLLDHVIRAAVGYRSRHRMNATASLDVWFPAWVPDLMLVDTFRTQFHRFDFDRGSIAAELRKANVNVTWYMDTPTGDGQVFGTQGAADLLGFPEDVVWFIAPTSTVLFIDGGTLDLGIVRDSDTNEVNDYQVFSETFENLAFIGHDLFKVTSTLCPSGAVGDVVDLSCGS